MPLDPSIILGGTNASAIANKQIAEQQAAEAQQQQIQMAKYTIASAKQDFTDRQNLTKAFQAANGDPTATVAIAGKLGVSSKALMAFQAQQLARQKEIADLDKVRTDTGKTKLDELNEKNEHLHSAIAPLLDIKDPTEYAARLPDAIRAARQQGLIDDDHAAAAATMGQDALKNFAATLLNTKANSELLNAGAAVDTAATKRSTFELQKDKFNAEKAGLIADTTTKKLGAASRVLLNAYITNGPVGYDNAKKQFQGDTDIEGSFPQSGAQLASMKPIDAQAAINAGGQTADQRQKTSETGAAAIEKKRIDDQTIAHQNAALALEQQKVALARKTVNAELGPDTIAGWSAQIKENPALVEELPPKLRSQVAFQFKRDTGVALPTKLTGDDKKNLTNARYTQNQVGEAVELAKDPEVQQIMGMMAGRAAKGESTLGEGLTAKQQKFVTDLEYLVLGEGKTVVGGRVPGEVLKALKSVSADPSKGLPQLIGSLQAANGAAQNRIDSTIAGQFAGKLPDFARQTDTNKFKPTVSSDQLRQYAKQKGASYGEVANAAKQQGYDIKD